jgi:hypothetical protein
MRIRIRIQLFTSMQIRIWILVKLCHHKNLIFYMNNRLHGGNGIKTYLRKYKSLFESQEIKFLLNLGHFPCSLIRVPKTVRIRIQERAKSIRIRIRLHNTALFALSLLIYLSFCVGGC